MIPFKNLFGIQSQEIKRTCVITPFLSKGLTRDLKIPQMFKGNPFAAGQSKHFTLIYSQIGAPFVGDAVLYLQNTFCENLILLGACGLVHKKASLDIGSLVAPTMSFSLESFSKLVDQNYDKIDSYYPSEALLNQFLEFKTPFKISKTTCATVGSIQLEEKYLESFKQNAIDVVDLECSAFFCAAKHINRKAIAFFYITDILKEKELHTPLSAKDRGSLRQAQKNIAKLISDFSKTL